MKIALIRPPATYANWYKQPALGIAYISACVKDRGFDCKIFDAYFHNWSQAELLHRVEDYNPAIVGLTAMTHEVNQAAEIATKLKSRMDVPIVIGGCHATALPQKTLAEFSVFDYGIFGEGEYTVIELLESIQHKKPTRELNNIRGCIFRDKDRIVVNDPRPFMTSTELNSLPYPSLNDYYADNSQALHSKDSYYVIFTSRGCPYNCAFCMQVLGRKVRCRSAQNIVREMNYAIEHYGAHTFDFLDEVFLFDNQVTRNLLKLFIRQNFHRQIKWGALTRANFVNPELIALAKKAGCVRLGMGVESGDDKILKAIGKGITVNQIRQAVKIIKQAKIPLATYYILGHPDETIESLRKTVDLAIELNTKNISVGLMVPYPGTRIYDMALQGSNGYHLLSQDWAEYDKYGGKVLEVKGVPYNQLVKWQRRTLLNLYLKNFRFLDCLRFFWKRRRAFYFVIKKKFESLFG